MENFHKVIEEYNNISGKVIDECIAYIRKTLKEHNNECVFNKDYDADDNNVYPEYVCVGYDGGNHPEYASNMFSEVFKVYLEDDNVYLEIDDCDKYDIRYINNSELIDITEMVESHFNK